MGVTITCRRGVGRLAFSLSASAALTVLSVTAAAQTGTPPPESGTESAIILDAIQVQGTAQSRYDSRHTDIGGRLTDDITEIPRSIDVIPEQLLQDQHAREMDEVYRYFPNVVNNDGYGGTREDYIIRGFRRRDDVYRNGVRLKSNSRIDPATVESIQIFKGPVSDIGQMTPGGLVNITTKKPSWTSRNHSEINFDEHGERQGMFDSTGAMSEEWAYRIVGSTENSQTFRDDTTIQRQFIAPTLTWVGANDATVTIGYEYNRDERPLDRGTITTATSSGARVVADPGRSVRYDTPFSSRDSRAHLGEVDASVPVGYGDWRIEGKLFYSNEQTNEIHSEVRSVLANGALVRRVEGNEDRDLSTFFSRLQAKGGFNAGLPIRVATGVEYRYQEESWINFVGANQTVGTVLNPMSGRLVNDSATASRSHRRVEQADFGPFIQADIDLLPTLTLTLGARYEYFRGSAVVRNLQNGSVTSGSYPTDQKLTKTAGLMWKATENVSLYASYADTFQPHNFYNGDTTVFPAEEGRQYEIGTKINLMGERVFLTGAVFDIEQENVVELVNGVARLTGGQTSRGFEVAMVGNPAEGWNIRAAFGYVDAEYVSHDSAIDGNRPTNVPTHNASLWSSYEFKAAAGILNGLGLGAGVTLVGDRYGDAEHTFNLGSYTLVDLGAWYYVPIGKDRQVRFDIGVKNVTDEDYLTASGGSYRVAVGSPRTFYGGISVDF